MSITLLLKSRFLVAAAMLTLVIWLSSCGVIPKDYPPNKPFVFKYTVTVEGNYTQAEKNDLSNRLSHQLDDSIRVRTSYKLFYKGRINAPVLVNPPEYKVANVERSIQYMRALLISIGYFKDSITYNTQIDTVKSDEYRTTVNFIVKPGKLVRIDSFAYNFKQPELQKIALDHQKNSYVKKGDPFSKSAISQELDRLVNLYRDNGFMRFGREELVGIWDTLDISLLRPTLDPLEQLAILQKLKERREHPTADLEIRLHDGVDSSKLKKYFIGNITVFPDVTYDSTSLKRKEEIVDGVKVVYYHRLFKPKLFPQNISFKKGELYNQQKYYETINRFNSLGAWRLVNIDQLARSGTDTADMNIRLTPAQKYSFTANLEADQNISAVSGNLVGLGFNVNLHNKNFAKSAIQTNTSLRYGVELGSDFVQTKQTSFSHTIYFPKVIPLIKSLSRKHQNNIRTVFSFNAANTERNKLYNLTSVNGSWGYEYQGNITKNNKQLRLFWKIPNIEYSLLKPRDSLLKLIANNPVLKNIFTDGFISSTQAGITIKNNAEKRPNLFSFNVEIPFIAGVFKSKFLDSQLYRFIKVNTEFSQAFKFNKSSLVFRLFGGIGYALNSTVNPNKRLTLPFFRQYFAGGPSSMRAWQLRRLGPGSVVKSFDDFPDRFGDVQLEFNTEFRFKIAKIAGTVIESALYTDIGNVWLLKKNAGQPEEVFNFSRLGKDIAIGAGTGLRFDFGFFLIRVDYAYKVKDPSPAVLADQNKWFHNWQLTNGQLQIGINYPFGL
ncbi:MAG: BamA/TamA family outer membrane protein [Chitinophagaceae bacterium]|nr:BamA/TamA family outer membrane protein [Chitinophagaceae bacterium]MCB0740448.1 BamA/TamA family outer membrane protein [Chitinophagaceae bacterium]